MRRGGGSAGFTVVESLVALAVATVLITIMLQISQSAIRLNAQIEKRTEAAALAHSKVQTYINRDFDTVPIGDVVTNYEVEEFSDESSLLPLNNPDARVFVEPASTLDPGSTTTTSYNQTILADAAFVAGSEIDSTRAHDAAGYNWRRHRVRDGNYNNY